MIKGLWRYLFFAVFLASALPASGQWNVIAGYDISGIRNTNMNGIINDYNAANPKVELAFKQVKVLHGFVAGFRYGYDWGGVEMTFSRRSTRRIGDAYDVAYGTEILDSVTREFLFIKKEGSELSNIDLHYLIKTISLTKEFGGAIRIGGSIDYNIYTYEVIYKPRNTSSPNLKNFSSHQTNWGSKLFIGAHLTNSTRMSFSIRAYYQWIWSNNSLESFERKFNILKPDCTYCTERPHSIGLSIIINNGLQP